MDAFFGGESLVGAILNSENGSRYAFEPLPFSAETKTVDGSVWTVIRTSHDIFLALFYSTASSTQADAHGLAWVPVDGTVTISGPYRAISNGAQSPNMKTAFTAIVRNSREINVSTYNSNMFGWSGPTGYIYEK